MLHRLIITIIIRPHRNVS